MNSRTTLFRIPRPRNAFALGVLLSVCLLPSRPAEAVGIDLLGEVAKPLIGVAKDKTQGMFRYLWLQPYGGYALGSGTLTKRGTGGRIDYTSGIKFEGLMYGGRGGFEVGNLFRLGLDYSKQFAKRKELVAHASGARTTETVPSMNWMLGILFGIDIPRTPLHAFGTRYIQAALQAEGPTSGTGWGAGVSFTLVNPFIVIAEYRWLEFSSELGANQEQSQRKMKQFYLGLSFLLL